MVIKLVAHKVRHNHVRPQGCPRVSITRAPRLAGDVSVPRGGPCQMQLIKDARDAVTNKLPAISSCIHARPLKLPVPTSDEGHQSSQKSQRQLQTQRGELRSIGVIHPQDGRCYLAIHGRRMVRKELL